MEIILYIAQYFYIYEKPKDMHMNDNHQIQDNVICTWGNVLFLM